MSVKVKLSYEHPGELTEVLARLGPDVKRWKVARREAGKFKKAYIDMELKDGETRDRE